MAKDKVKIYIGVVKKSSLKFDSKHWRSCKDKNYYFCKIDEYYLKYSFLPDNKNLHNKHWGYLTVDFSVSKVMNAKHNNAIPITKINSTQILEKLCSYLEEVLYFDKIPIFHEWQSAKDETFIDIIAPKEVLESIYRIIAYSKLPRRKVDDKFKDEGSIYVHSGKDRAKATWQLIAYDKVKEGDDKAKEKNAKVKSISEIKGLKEGQGCIRLELKTKRYALKKLIKDFKAEHNSDKFKSILLNNSTYIDDIDPTTVEAKGLFTYVLDPDFQADVLLSILKDLHLLDKKILSRDELFNFINSSEEFHSPAIKKNAIKAVRMLNGERIRGMLEPRTLTDYRKQLLDLGVHYIYVDHPIPEISQAMLDKAIYETGNLVIA